MALQYLILENENSACHLVNELDGIAMVLEAMKTFPNDAVLQQAACSVISNLLSWNAFNKELEQASGDQALLGAKKKFDGENTAKPAQRLAPR